MPDTKEQNVVLKSTKYDKFKFIHNNRDYSRGHVELIKKAFGESGNLTAVQPILVNEKMEIIDGQHRYVACKELGEPIYYMIQPGLRISDARAMNILQRNWTSLDYAKSYADGGNVNYQQYIELLDDYGFTHNIVLSYIYNDFNKEIKPHAEFRSGKMVITDLPAIRARLDKLAELREVGPSSTRNATFARAYLRVIATPGFDQARMLRKVRDTGDSVLKQYSSVADDLRALEDVYNYRMSEGNRLRLY